MTYDTFQQLLVTLNIVRVVCSSFVHVAYTMILYSSVEEDLGTIQTRTRVYVPTRYRTISNALTMIVLRSMYVLRFFYKIIKKYFQGKWMYLYILLNFHWPFSLILSVYVVCIGLDLYKLTDDYLLYIWLFIPLLEFLFTTHKTRTILSYRSTCLALVKNRKVNLVPTV